MMNTYKRRPAISIKQKKNVFTGHIVRAAVLARSRVIEAVQENETPFYVVFYNGSVIYGGEVRELKEGSFIDHAFNEGMVFCDAHPALRLMSEKQPLSVPNKNKLFSKLQDDYSLIEVAYIATLLDAFFRKEQLTEIIQKILSHLQRSGRHFTAFRVSRILRAFVPDAVPAQNHLTSRETHSFDNMYRGDLSSVQTHDPLYVEQYCFSNRFKPNERHILHQTLEADDRLFDALLLWLEDIETREHAHSVKKYTEIALQFASMDDWIDILTAVNVNPFRALPESKAYIEHIVKAEKYEDAIMTVLPCMDDLPESFHSVLKSLWTQLSPAFVAEHLDDLIPALKPFAAKDDDNIIEEVLFRLAVHLFTKYDLPAVRQKFSSVKHVFPHSEVIRNIDDMFAWSEDPERMMSLGKQYAAFQQFDRAIECFSLEMGFHPDDPVPVWYLSKMYQHKGMKREAEAYQKFFAELKAKA